MKRMITLLVLGLIIVAGSAGVASAALIAHFEFEGNFLDSSGNDLHGTATGAPTFVPSTDRYLAAGLFGEAMSLDAADAVDFVTVADNDLLDVTSFTLMTWVKVTCFGPSPWGWNTFINKAGAPDDPAHPHGTAGFKMEERGETGEILVIVETPPWNAGIDWGGPAGITPTIEGTGLWHHIAGTLDVATGVQNFFVDGALVATATGTPPPPMAGSLVDLVIGSTDGSTMLIDEMRIYDRALALEEINAVSKIPEPATMILLGIGLSGLALLGKKKK